jgi:proteasome lid subunit RPN8/RPN11
MLALTRRVYDDVIGHARERAPAECCGVLGGERRADDPLASTDESTTAPRDGAEKGSSADRYRRASNVATEPRTAYELDPTEQLAHMQSIEDSGREVVGFVHSHPAGPPAPSRTDERQATWTGYSYVIVSLGGAEPFVGSWRWTGTAFEREVVAVQIADSPT